MNKFKISSSKIVRIFTDLCLSQVKEQLTENLTYFNANPPSFILDGNLFAYTINQSFLNPESLNNFGSCVILDKRLN